jgi:hypothetical protein
MRALLLQRLRTAVSGDYIPVWLRQPSLELLLNSGIGANDKNINRGSLFRTDR